jgi:hypothetical protein
VSAVLLRRSRKAVGTSPHVPARARKAKVRPLYVIDATRGNAPKFGKTSGLSVFAQTRSDASCVHTLGTTLWMGPSDRGKTWGSLRSAGAISPAHRPALHLSAPLPPQSLERADLRVCRGSTASTGPTTASLLLSPRSPQTTERPGACCGRPTTNPPARRSAQGPAQGSLRRGRPMGSSLPRDTPETPPSLGVRPVVQDGCTTHRRMTRAGGGFR